MSQYRAAVAARSQDAQNAALTWVLDTYKSLLGKDMSIATNCGTACALGKAVGILGRDLTPYLNG